jgi:hypothetical protein
VTAIRYRVDDVPSWGMGAFAPVPAMTGTAATAGTQRRYLQQWTDAPNPGQNAFNNGPCWNDGNTQGSYVDAHAAGVTSGAFIPRPSPNARHFMQYWVGLGPSAGPNGTDLTMAIFSDTPVPVPAHNIGRAAMPAMKQPPWATIVSTAWPRPFISWPSWGSSRAQ